MSDGKSVYVIFLPSFFSTFRNAILTALDRITMVKH